jgi:hypothetical protein
MQLMGKRFAISRYMVWQRPDLVLSCLSRNMITGRRAELGEDW